MAWASSSCPGVQPLNNSSVARSRASCCQAAESIGASVESAALESDSSYDADKVEPCQPRLLPASVIRRHTTQRYDAMDRVIATRSVILSLHPTAQIGDGGEKRCRMSKPTERNFTSRKAVTGI